MKTDLAHHDPFTTALRSLGRISFAKESGKKIYTAVLVFQRFHYFFFWIGKFSMNNFIWSSNRFGSYHIDTEILCNYVELTVKVYKGRESLSYPKLEKEYQDWIFLMHEKYDEEIGCGEDQPVLVLSPSNKKGLGISSDGKAHIGFLHLCDLFTFCIVLVFHVLYSWTRIYLL